MCLVLTSRIFCQILVNYTPSDNMLLKYICGLVASLLAFLVSVLMREELDIKYLLEKRLVVFDNFGIRD